MIYSWDLHTFGTFSVSEEVFNSAEALWFSPSGSYLAVASFNDTEVESAVFPYYGNSADINDQYPHEIRFKYPKVGILNDNLGLFSPNTGFINLYLVLGHFHKFYGPLLNSFVVS